MEGWRGRVFVAIVVEDMDSCRDIGKDLVDERKNEAWLDEGRCLLCHRRGSQIKGWIYKTDLPRG